MIVDRNGVGLLVAESRCAQRKFIPADVRQVEVKGPGM